MSDPTTMKIEAMVKAAVEAVLGNQSKATKAVAKGNGKAPQDAAQMDQMVIKAFRRAGYTDAQPRQNIMTYRKWLEQGRKVKVGEKSIAVRQFRLFHLLQTEEFSPSTSVVPIKGTKGKGKKATAQTVEPTLPLGA